MGYRLVVYPDYASLERPDPNEERRQLSYTYRGGWGDPSSSAKSDDDVLVDLGKFDPTAVIGVLRGAPETLGIKPDDVSSTYLIVDPTRDPITPGELSLSIYVSSDYGSGYIELDGRRHRQADQLPELSCGIPFAEIDVLYVRTRTSAPKRWFGQSECSAEYIGAILWREVLNRRSGQAKEVVRCWSSPSWVFCSNRPCTATSCANA